MVGTRKQAMTRSSLQQKNINANFIACELSVKRIDTLGVVFFDFSLTVKAAPHECVIRTGQP